MTQGINGGKENEDETRRISRRKRTVKGGAHREDEKKGSLY